MRDQLMFICILLGSFCGIAFAHTIVSAATSDADPVMIARIVTRPPTELPASISLKGRVVSNDEGARIITIDAISPYSLRETFRLNIGYADAELIYAPHGGNALEAGDAISVQLQRKPGPLDALTIVEIGQEL